MTVKIKVYSDYVCPFCFLAEKPLEEAIKGKDVEVEWMPYELRPYPNETLIPEGEYLQSTWRQSVYPMAERMGIDIVLPKVSPQPYTHLAFEGYQYAKEKGKANEYNDRMLRAFFQEEQDIGNIEVLTKLAGEIGLDEIEYREALETRKYKEAHQKALKHAYTEANITAVPTFVIGDTKIAGIRSKETLEQIINDELSRQITDFPEGMACGVDGC
ncbi:2-hydroxychromene-2-carboxylate isomerase [Caldibacillus thermoamylovorans]|uniref:DsbA family oxidoreductase n=1 Tax=Caldibacillus thermoamylovorans TaxID=35841 RepID=UPI000D558CAC|nr:DsbA family oxidoreductase [Caldibacillus thermoamylovorans]AWI10923.1 2-hydroxychromene-2-carboxylate isomerase [Caldibacillus thermoamylovorans]